MFGSHAIRPNSGATLSVLPFSGLGHCTTQAEILAGEMFFVPLRIRTSSRPRPEFSAATAGYRLHLHLGREIRGR